MAMGSMNDEDDAPMADINVTPLVDVMLVLLIVFMITMPVLTHSLALELPTASAKTQEKPKIDIKPVQIVIDASGQYAIGAESTEKISLDTLKIRLSDIAQKDPETVVAIDADKSVEYDFVVKVLEAAREVGLSKIGFRMKVEGKE